MVDLQNFPRGIIARAWEELERKTPARDSTPTYAKVFQDWEKDGDGDPYGVFLKGPVAHWFYMTTKAQGEAAGVPWSNKVTLRSYLNVAATEAHDFAPRVKYPCFYVVNDDDPLAPSPEWHRCVVEKLPNVEFSSIPGSPDGLGGQLGVGIELIVQWLGKVLQ
jgi:hypothetical protein